MERRSIQNREIFPFVRELGKDAIDSNVFSGPIIMVIKTSNPEP